MASGGEHAIELIYADRVGRLRIPERFELSGDQRALFEALDRRSTRIAQIYVGAHIVLADGANPERFCCAAHELRELIEKVPEIVDVQMQAARENMKQKAQALEKEYDSALRKTQLKPPNWDGAVDLAMVGLLRELQRFVEWVRANAVSRKDEYRSMLRALGGQGPVLPPTAEDRMLRSLDELKKFFNNVSHHRHNPTAEQFQEQMSKLESFLLKKLNPQTFADFDALDTIIGEGEPNDQR